MTEGCPSSSNGTGKGFDSSLLLFRSMLPCKLNGSELVFSLSEMKHGCGRILRSPSPPQASLHIHGSESLSADHLSTYWLRFIIY